MKHCISNFLNNNNSNFNEYINCYCLVTRIKGDKIEYSRKNPFKIIFQDNSVVFLGINTPLPSEYHFGYEHITNCNNENKLLKLEVQDFYYHDTKFSFEFLFVFDKYILDAFSVEKQNFETLLDKNIYINYSKSWFDERKECTGKLKKVGDLRIKVEESDNTVQEIEIFDVNFFFAKL